MNDKAQAEHGVSRVYGGAFRVAIREEFRGGETWQRARIVDPRGRIMPDTEHIGGLYRSVDDAYASLARGLRHTNDAAAEANREAIRVFGSTARVTFEQGVARAYCHCDREPSVDEDDHDEAMLSLALLLRAMPDFPADEHVTADEAMAVKQSFGTPAEWMPSIEERLCDSVIALHAEIVALKGAK